jgi:hypothetical protein
LQKREAVYSFGNLLVLIGLVTLIVFTLLPSVVEVSGLTRTGINLLSSFLIFLGSAMPFILKEMGMGEKFRSIGMRCFTSSFMMSIIMVLQMLTRGWASTVPVLASISLASLGIISYAFSAKGGRLTLPGTRNILIIISVVIIFSTPIIQLSLIRLGFGADGSRTLSISLLTVFTIVLYLSLKASFKKEGHQVEEKVERNP